MPAGPGTREAISAPMWAKMATAVLQSAAPRPPSHPSRTAAAVGGSDQAERSPNGAVSRQAFRQ